jgi:hypothetical protein
MKDLSMYHPVKAINLNLWMPVKQNRFSFCLNQKKNSAFSSFFQYQ